jgi:methyl-accepting chemotaxis protein
LNIRSIRFTTKLFTGILAILVLSLAVVIAVTTVDVAKGLLELGKEFRRKHRPLVFNSLNAQNSCSRKARGDMIILEGDLERYGSFDLDSSYMLERTITNQVTKTQEQVKMPRLMLGGMVMNGNTGIVDKIQQMTGGVATVFQVLDGKLLRVSTKSASTRPIGPWTRSFQRTVPSTRPS